MLLFSNVSIGYWINIVFCYFRCNLRSLILFSVLKLFILTLLLSGFSNQPFFVDSCIVLKLHICCISGTLNLGISFSSFFSCHIEYMSSFGCNDLYIVINFFVFWFIWVLSLSVLRKVQTILRGRLLIFILLISSKRHDYKKTSWN